MVMAENLNMLSFTLHSLILRRLLNRVKRSDKRKLLSNELEKRRCDRSVYLLSYTLAQYIKRNLFRVL
jgi:hypothetical protein